MKVFEYLNHTADLGIKVFGSTIKELFLNTGQAIFSTIVAGKLNPKQQITINLDNESLEELLVDWCRELLYNFAVHRYIPVDYKLSLQEHRLRAELRVDIFNPRQHKIKTDIKNVTYHNLEIKKVDDHYEGSIIFDV